MGSGPDSRLPGPMAPNPMGPVMNGDGLDGMKNSPANGGPGTPREDNSGGMGEYNLGGFGGSSENVSIPNVSSINSFPVKPKEEPGNWKNYVSAKDEPSAWNARLLSNVKSEDDLEWGYPDLFENSGVKNETVGSCRPENRGDTFRNPNNWSFPSSSDGRMSGGPGGEAGGEQKTNQWSSPGEVSSSTSEKSKRSKKF